MKTSFKYLTVFFLIFLNACGSSSDDEIIDPIDEIVATINSNKLNLKDTEIATITVSDFSLDQELYNATFGNIGIVLKKTTENQLNFLVPPNIESGAYQLEVDFSSNSLEFNITKTVLQDTPENTIINFAGSFDTDIDDTIALFDQGNVPPQLLSAKDDIQKAISELNSLSDEDKIVAARFIENNSLEINELESLLAQQDILYSSKSQSKQCNTPQCYFAYGAKVLLAVTLLEAGGTIAVIGAVIVGVDAIISLIRGKQSILVSRAKKVAEEALNITLFWRNKLLDMVFDKANNTIFNKSQSQNDNEIENKTVVNFNIKPTKRTLDSEDSNSTEDFVNEFVSAYLLLRNFWNENFANTLGVFPDFNNKEEQVFADELSQFSLAISSNSDSIEISDISGNVEEFSASFTNKTDIEQDFTLDVIFTESDIEAKTSIDFTIGFDEITLVKVSGDNQIGVKDEVLDKPIVVKVIDNDGNAIKDVDVDFEVIEGEGKVSTSSVKTNDEGLAQVNWTLGNNLDNQKLEVSVKNSQGDNIDTSPITFTAASKELILSLEKVSGDNQSGNENEQLENPLKVKVTDEEGKGVSGVIVEFSITAGNGSLSNTSLVTDSNGFAQVNWTLGDDVTSQKVDAVVKDSSGNNIEGSPITFTAILNFNMIGTWNYKNLDTNTRYENGEICNGMHNAFVSNVSSKFIFSENNVGVGIDVYKHYEYLDSFCTANGWDLGAETQRQDTESHPLEWFISGSIITLVFDNGTDSYDLPITFIDKDNVSIINSDGETILLERE